MQTGLPGESEWRGSPLSERTSVYRTGWILLLAIFRGAFNKQRQPPSQYAEARKEDWSHSACIGVRRLGEFSGLRAEESKASQCGRFVVKFLFSAYEKVSRSAEVVSRGVVPAVGDLYEKVSRSAEVVSRGGHAVIIITLWSVASNLR